MHSKVKYALLMFIILLLGGCSALRKGRMPGSVGGTGALNYHELAGTVSGYNITGRGFEIRKGTIELDGTEIEGRFGLHARLNSRGDFYGSVRGPLGVELVRILMVGNDIAAIDRINKTVYIGKKDEVLRKNGLPEDFMNIIMGDMPAETDGNFRNSNGNKVTVTAGDRSFRREISICLDEMKVCTETIEALNSGHNISLAFENFVLAGGIKYPSFIVMEEKSRMFHVKLSISDLIYGYDSDIIFNIPAYKKEEL